MFEDLFGGEFLQPNQPGLEGGEPVMSRRERRQRRERSNREERGMPSCAVPPGFDSSRREFESSRRNLRVPASAAKGAPESATERVPESAVGLTRGAIPGVIPELPSVVVPGVAPGAIPGGEPVAGARSADDSVPQRALPPAVRQPPVSPASADRATGRRKTPVSVLIMSGVGQTMLTVGVLLALFVVWQLYVTTWQVQGARAQAVESFAQSGVKEATQLTEEQRRDSPPEVSIPPLGQTFSTLHVPRWDSMVIPIMQGTTEEILNTGYAGHYVDSQGPGELGNFALAAHRRSYGNSFRRVEELRVGDPLVVETDQAWLVYRVASTEVVLPSQGDVIYPVPHKPKDTVPTRRLMTLTTCHPEYGNTQRFIVYSELAYWVPRSQGRPVALQGKLIPGEPSLGSGVAGTGDSQG